MSRLSGMLEHYNDESWKIDHDRAMQRYDFDDWLAIGLKFLELIREKERDYHERLKTKQIELDHRVIEEIQKLYERWYAPCRGLLNKLDQFEHEGFACRNAEAFRAACMSSNIPGFEPSKLQAAAQRASAGAVRSARQVRDELQHRLRG